MSASLSMQALVRQRFIAAFLRWEANRRAGDCMPAAKLEALTPEQLAERRADTFIELLGEIPFAPDGAA